MRLQSFFSLVDSCSIGRRIPSTQHRSAPWTRLSGFLTLALVVAPDSWAQAPSQLVGTTAGQFSVSSNGAATYSVPITVAPGAGGMGPKLNLSYTSQSGNGPLGVGFTLGGLSGVSRCRATIVQDGFSGGIRLDANDRFCLDGQRLMVVSGTYGAVGAEYRTEIDSYSRVVSIGGSFGDPQGFRVQTKAGLTMEYGLTPDSRVEAIGKAQALSWAANRISDTAGNYMTMSYNEDSVNGESTIARIDYAGNIYATSPNNSVAFDYSGRDDTNIAYVAGSGQTRTKLLTTITTQAQGRNGRTYSFAYAGSEPTQRDRGYKARVVSNPGVSMF